MTSSFNRVDSSKTAVFILSLKACSSIFCLRHLLSVGDAFLKQSLNITYFHKSVNIIYLNRPIEMEKQIYALLAYYQT